MKWNWGTKIVLSFIGFAGFMLYLVFMSFQQNIDLVTEDYYGEELKYEQRITEIKNAAGLDEKIKIEKHNHGYVINFPQDIIETGRIHFYKPDNKILDKVYDVKDLKNSFSVSHKDLIPGRYRVKISWETSGKRFYHEEEIFVR